MSSPDWRIGSGGEARISPDGLTELSGQSWTGRFERTSFGPGFHMHHGRIDVAAPTELPVTAGDEGPPLISVYALVSGEAQLRVPGWPDLALAPGMAILVTLQERCSVFILPGPQTLRFFSVAMAPDLLASLLDGHVPPSLAPLLDGGGPYSLVHERPVSAATRSQIAALGGPRDAGALHRLQSEAVGLRLLTEILRAELAEASMGLSITASEEAAVRVARRRLIEDLRDAPRAGLLAERAGMGLRRFLRAFEALHGASPAQVLRAERLHRARQLLDQRDLPLKEIAWRVGYNHVSNFTAAFADQFGAPPRRYMRQG